MRKNIKSNLTFNKPKANPRVIHSDEGSEMEWEDGNESDFIDIEDDHEIGNNDHDSNLDRDSKSRSRIPKTPNETTRIKKEPEWFQSTKAMNSADVLFDQMIDTEYKEYQDDTAESEKVAQQLRMQSLKD
ncbi:hypothetical protein AYI69_g9656 [Smittium culicis]|uniref:Uncharacterized protein n=1 Tax=Smittium culicis TaxID=133412 RepID=A0A1R1XB93_9FUNG|nr:hypothetical protein AYI69_g9656 [Smittium culicis]